MSNDKPYWRNAAADRLAYTVAGLVERRVIGERSAAADALLDYLDVGHTGPASVPEWMQQYEQEQRKQGITPGRRP